MDMALQVGDKAPEILGLDQAGKEIRLSDFAGKKLALYFYPKDNTSGCTAEACSFRDNYGALREAGYEVVGVSKDSAKSHQGFIAKQNLPFTLIADTETALQQNVWRMGGKEDVWPGLYGNRPHHLYHRRDRHDHPRVRSEGDQDKRARKSNP